MVLEYSGNAEDYSLGLISCASGLRQPAFYESPTDKEFIREGSGESDTRARESLLRRTTGYGTAWNDREESYRLYGHTAYIYRERGHVKVIRGFRPVSHDACYFQRDKDGASPALKGHWCDDMALLREPTSVSWEFPLYLTAGENVISRLNTLETYYRKYQMYKPDNMVSFNCLLAAKSLLCRYFRNYAGGYPLYEKFALELDRLIPPYAGEDHLRSGSQGILVGCITYGPQERARHVGNAKN